MDKWEYKTLSFQTTGFSGGKLNVNEFDQQLNFYGSDGWEVVSCFDTNASYGQTRNVFVLLKRKRN